MSYYIEPAAACYFPVPKCACTSLKNYAFRLQTGRVFKGSAEAERAATIHHHIRSSRAGTSKRQAPQDSWKFAVVRHPLDRLVSCYQSKVLEGERALDQVSTPILKAFGLRRDPTFEEFARDLPRYQLVSANIKHHSRPLRFFLGTDAGYFDRVYGMAEIPVLVDDLTRRSGIKRRPPRRNQSARSHVVIGPEDVTEAAVAITLRRFRSDFDIFGESLGSSKFLP